MLIRISKLLIVISLYGVFSITSANQDKTKVASVFTVTPTSITKSLQIIGEIKAEKSSNIYAPIDGKIDILEVIDHNHIHKNQTIAIIENKILANQVKLSRENLALAKEVYQKISKLNQLESISQERLTITKQQLLQAEINLNEKLLELEKTYIRAPLSGLLGDIKVTEGAMVKNGDLIATMYDTATYLVEMHVSSKLLPFMKVGNKITIEKELIAYISNVANALDNDTKLIRATAKIVDCKECQIGKIVSMDITTEHRDNVLAVPNSSIYYYNGKPHLTIVKDNKAQKIPVQIGIQNKDFTEITSGLHANDMVIHKNSNMYNNNDLIKIHEPST